ncbi:NADPH dehydrogenase [Stachybotrys elegans]|uniref:NADPH dehydrogenase n=1 Tax=Stachybotrys elegans TaxID=80388 RepID=A0A8K0SZU2_9HYPO|nr:NADPH dehydrogenase [Stachybotrys elegans]
MGSTDSKKFYTAAEGLPFFAPAQEPAVGAALDPDSAPALFKPFKMRSLTLANRLVVSPMCTYCSRDGHMSDWHIAHLGKFALGGAGLVFTEAAAVEPRGRISPQDAGLWEDSQIEQLRRIISVVHSQGSKAGIQLAHAGRKASTLAPFISSSVKKTLADESNGGWPNDVVGPSAIPWDESFAVPKELSIEDIKGTVKLFADAAERAVKAGFDLIEIHAAHGYLLTSFLSPLSNKRTDQYGGSFENRSRMLREVVEAVRAVIPETMPLWVRISATEWMEWAGEPSWDINESIQLAKVLPSLGVDVLDVSSGGNHSGQKIVVKQAMHTPFANQIRKALRTAKIQMPLAIVGTITEPQMAKFVAEEGNSAEQTIEVDTEDGASQGDLVLLGRQFLREPEFVLRAAHELKVPVKWPLQYARATPRFTSRF